LFARKSQGGSGVYAARLLEQFAHRTDLSLTSLQRMAGQRTKGKLRSSCATDFRNMLWTHARLSAVLWRSGFDLLHAPASIAPLASRCPTGSGKQHFKPSGRRRRRRLSGFPTDEDALLEALQDVIHNLRTATELKAGDLARAKQFNWQRIAAKTLEVYRTVMR
jgi:hypothetical protein